MATNQSLDLLTAKTTPTTSDVLYILDVADVTQSAAGSSKSLTIGNLATMLASNTKTLTNTTFDTAGTGNVFKINGTSITDKTGTGKVVLDTSPTLTTPTLGVATATSINKVAITAPATSATLTIADGKTLTVNKSLTFAGTDSTTMTFPTSSDTVAGLAAVQIFTNKTIVDATNIISFNSPQNFMINGQITVSISSNNLTVAIKGLNGSDPSASNPVYVRVGNNIRTITSALSKTLNAGTNWFNAGSAELATFEIDYFVYIGYNATDGVVMGFARFPTAMTYGDFNTTSTNEKYCAITTITNAASTDQYVLVGRFNSILGISASYNWSAPGTSIIFNRPIFETRILQYAPQWKTGGTAPSLGNGTLTGKYRVEYFLVYMKFEWFAGSTTTFGTLTYYFTFPFSTPADARRDIGQAWFLNGSTPRIGISLFSYTAPTGIEFISNSNASVTATSPATFGSGDRINAEIDYEWA